MARLSSQAALASLAVLALPLVTAPAGAQLSPLTGVTPNAERVVEIAAIDKRSGRTETFRGNPGQSFIFGRLTISVKTCEMTAPWEEKLTGAFLQIDQAVDDAPKRIFSGWMFAESPSLNPLEHPRYDVWVKSCAMRWPESAPAPAPAADSAPS